MWGGHGPNLLPSCTSRLNDLLAPMAVRQTTPVDIREWSRRPSQLSLDFRAGQTLISGMWKTWSIVDFRADMASLREVVRKPGFFSSQMGSVGLN